MLVASSTMQCVMQHLDTREYPPSKSPNNEICKRHAVQTHNPFTLKKTREERTSSATTTEYTHVYHLRYSRLFVRARRVFRCCKAKLVRRVRTRLRHAPGGGECDRGGSCVLVCFQWPHSSHSLSTTT